MPEGYRIERGCLWPASDVSAAQAIFETIGDLDRVYPHCRGFKVAVQAGGNCGIWPASLAKRFEQVFTFEPDAMNYRCLCENASAKNIFKFNAALGSKREFVGLHRRPENIGAHFIEGYGAIKVMTIDELKLGKCDLIYLDIEGYELPALQGAIETISTCRPIIVVEDKGMSEKYGIPKGVIERWLQDRFGYRVVDRPNRDVVLAP